MIKNCDDLRSFLNFNYKSKNMDALKQMREDVKKYIDTADAKVVKMVHAMLEVENEGDWWQNKEILSIVEERAADYKSGKVKGVAWDIFHTMRDPRTKYKRRKS
jgi:flavoprotein